MIVISSSNDELEAPSLPYSQPSVYHTPKRNDCIPQVESDSFLEFEKEIDESFLTRLKALSKKTKDAEKVLCVIKEPTNDILSCSSSPLATSNASNPFADLPGSCSLVSINDPSPIFSPLLQAQTKYQCSDLETSELDLLASDGVSSASLMTIGSADELRPESTSDHSSLSCDELYAEEVLKNLGISQSKVRVSFDTLFSDKTTREIVASEADKVPKSKESAIKELLLIINYDWAIKNAEILRRLQSEGIEFWLENEMKDKIMNFAQFELALSCFFNERQRDPTSQSPHYSVFLDITCPVRIFRVVTASLASKLSKHLKSHGSAKPLTFKRLRAKCGFETMLLCPFTFHFLDQQSLLAFIKDDQEVDRFIEKYSLGYFESRSKLYYPNYQHYWYLFMDNDGDILKARKKPKKKKDRINHGTAEIYYPGDESQACIPIPFKASEFDNDLLLDWLVKLQLRYPNAWTTLDSKFDFCDYFIEFLRTFAISPYSKENYDLGFCTTGKKSVKGKNASETFRKMLQEIQGCSEAVASAIVQKYPSFLSLFNAYSDLLQRGLSKDSALLLSTIQVVRQKSQKKLGDALSIKIFSAIMGTDPKTRLT